MTGQMTIFDFIESESDFPCDNCLFDKNGCCDHISEDSDTYKFWCISGSFQLKHGSETCPNCGRKMEVVQSCFGSDWARCKCGTSKIFNNQGNRISHFDAWKKGMLVGE